MTTSNIPSEIRGVSTFIVKTIVNMIVSLPFLMANMVVPCMEPSKYENDVFTT